MFSIEEILQINREKK